MATGRGVDARNNGTGNPGNRNDAADVLRQARQVSLAPLRMLAINTRGHAHEVIAINSAAVEPVMKRAYAYSRTAYETAAETNNEVKRVFEKQAAELNRATVAALEEAFKYAPAGSETVVENVKAAIAAAQSAYNNVASINKQIYDTVEKSVEQNVRSVKSAAAKAKSKKR